MTTETKKSSKALIGVVIAVLLGVAFLGLLLLSVKNDARDVQQYAKTWSGDKSHETTQMHDDMASMPMGDDMQNMHHHH